MSIRAVTVAILAGVLGTSATADAQVIVGATTGGVHSGSPGVTFSSYGTPLYGGYSSYPSAGVWTTTPYSTGSGVITSGYYPSTTSYPTTTSGYYSYTPSHTTSGYYSPYYGGTHYSSNYSSPYSGSYYSPYTNAAYNTSYYGGGMYSPYSGSYGGMYSPYSNAYYNGYNNLYNTGYNGLGVGTRGVNFGGRRIGRW